MSQTRTPLSERKAAQARIEADLDRQAEQIDMDAKAARLRALMAPTGFTVQINERQRALLQLVLEAAILNPSTALKALPADPSGTNDCALGDAEDLAGMIRDLPKHEADQPGCVHGLCL